MIVMQSRRGFMALATGAAGFAAAPALAAGGGAPETAAVRFANAPNYCIAPQYLAHDLLRAEGFEEVRYVEAPTGPAAGKAVAEGRADFYSAFAPDAILQVDAGEAITIVAGVHVGCFELFAHPGVGSIVELKGRRVAVVKGSSGYRLLTMLMRYVGFDPDSDIVWVTSDRLKPLELFIAGEADAVLAFPPAPQELRARGIGQVIASTTTDRPWSQYLCCVVQANSEFVQRHPVATKRVIRAILKASDLCADEPERMARQLVERGVAQRYDYAVQVLGELSFRAWREYDVADSIRFYALRMREIGFIAQAPSEIIRRGTDLRYFNELKRELKA